MATSFPHPRTRGALGFISSGAAFRQAASGGTPYSVIGYVAMGLLFAVAAVQMLDWHRSLKSGN